MSKKSDALFQMYSQLGFENAPELAMKAEAILFIRSKMDERKLTQKALADMIGWRPSRLSDLLRGKLELFTYKKINEVLAPFGGEIQENPKLATTRPIKPEYRLPQISAQRAVGKSSRKNAA